MSFDDDEEDVVDAWYVWVTGSVPEFMHGPNEGSVIDRYVEKNRNNIKINQRIHVASENQVAVYNVGVTV